MKTEDRIWVEFLIFCGFIFLNFVLLLAYGIWLDHRPSPTFRIWLAETLGEASEIPFLLWYGPYLLHVLARAGVFLWRRKHPKPGEGRL